MLAPHSVRLLICSVGVALVLCCGAGVSEDPLARRPSLGASGVRLNATGALCGSGGDCASNVCLPDVEGTARCCAANCLTQGRVCSTQGECVCRAEAREVGGRCLLREGQLCRQGPDCASNQCTDGVCCDSACDGVCERCDAPEQAGTCALHAEDTACTARTGYACTGRNRCRLPLGVSCGTDAECDSDQCEPGERERICCAQACSGVCQLCGESGSCDAFPPTSSQCPALTCPEATRCRNYQTPAINACSANAQCAQCTPVDERAGTPCGVGAQCDGAGTCNVTGIGAVAAGLRHTCAITASGNVRCWGSNSAGQLGAVFDRTLVGNDLDVPLAQTPGLEIDFGRDVEQLSAGFSHTCALFKDGAVRCWGRVQDFPGIDTVPSVLGTDTVVLNELGFVDPLRTGDVKLPGPAEQNRAIQISASAYGAHTCALLASGDISCWGLNDAGQCGVQGSGEVAAEPDRPLPIVNLGGKALEVKAGAAHTCALLETGGVTCWGLGASGRLGYGSTTNRLPSSGEVPLGAPAITLATGATHTCAVLKGGSVRCWGGNDWGQLGYGHGASIGDGETPLEAASLLERGPNFPLGGDVQVGGGRGVVQVVSIVDYGAICVLFVGGAVRCWGQNDRGQLGYGYIDDPLLPEDRLARKHTPDDLARGIGVGTSARAGMGDLPLGGPVRALADNGRCALRVDGQLYCWGRNADAELGLPEAFPTASETLLPSEMGPVLWEPAP